MTLIEVEGGHWLSGVDPKTGKPRKGRHNTGKGFEDDCEKYLEAALLGYKVIRLVDKQLTVDSLDRIARNLERYVRSDADLLDLLKD